MAEPGSNRWRIDSASLERTSESPEQRECMVKWRNEAISAIYTTQYNKNVWKY